MLTQLFIGSLLTLCTVAIATASWWALDWVLRRMRDWIVRPPHGPRLMFVLAMTLIWTLFMMTLAVWVWAASFKALGIFLTLEGSVYFDLVA